MEALETAKIAIKLKLFIHRVLQNGYDRKNSTYSSIWNTEDGHSIDGSEGKLKMSPSQMITASGSVPAIDLASLLGRCLGNFKMVERVLSAFRNAGSSDLIQLQSAVEESNFTEIAEIAHRFKGSASNVSATILQDLLAQVEQLGREKHPDSLPSLIERLKAEWSSFENYAQVFAPAES